MKEHGIRSLSPTDYRTTVWWLIGLSLLTLGFRILGPGDLDTKDQPKTVAYTVDILDNGRWEWPRDMLGRPATKPPLYNWLATPGIALTGLYHEVTFKLPSIIAGLGCLVLLMVVAGRFVKNDPGRISPSSVALFAGIAWLANSSVYGLIYTARPDMLLTFFLFAAWAVGTLLLDDTPLPGPRWIWPVLLWSAVLGAILTKGTPSLLIVLYLPIYAVLRHRSWKSLYRVRYFSGLFFVLALSVGWGWLTLRSIPPDHWEFMLQEESGRIVNGGAIKSLMELYKMPHYFLVRFLPWSIVFLIFFIRTERGQLRSSRWSSVFLWFLLNMVFFSIPTVKRDDYILPVFPVCALAVGYAVARVSRLWRRIALVAAVGFLVGAYVDDVAFKDHLQPRYGDNTAAFSQSVRQLLPAGAPLVPLQTGYNNLQAYLGMNRFITAVEPATGTYVLAVAYLLTDEQAREYRQSGIPRLDEYEPLEIGLPAKAKRIALSPPIPTVRDESPGLIGLYLLP